MDMLERAQLIAAAREWAASGAARLIRKGAGLSLGEMAELVDDTCSASTVKRWEDGAARPRGDHAARYGEVLREMMSPAWHLARRQNDERQDVTPGARENFDDRSAGERRVLSGG